MEIEATTLKDFENQYYKQFNNKIPVELQIRLRTNDDFWKEVTEKTFESSLNIMTDDEKTKTKELISQFYKVYLPAYGTITRIV